jgi:3-carboxy-cis,cis-muconate cycloisomerase
MFCDPEIAAELDADAFTSHMLAFEEAWTQALLEVGEVSTADASAALKAISAFESVHHATGSKVDGLPVPAFVRSLRAGLEEGPAKAIHTGSTSQDVIDTAMALTLLRIESIISERLTKVARLVEELCGTFGDAPLMARTRMQAALPATAGIRLSAWLRAIDGQIERAATARREIAIVQIGGPIGLRSEPVGKGEAVAEIVAKELGLSVTPVWHTDRSAPVQFGHWLTLVSGTLGKIGQDIVLMTQQGIDEIVLKGGGSSSAMPHKQNPVGAEAMVTLARFVATQQGALAQSMIHEQERSGSAWALEWLTLPAMAEATGASLNHCLEILGQIERIGAVR